MATRASIDDRRLRPARLDTAVARPSTAPHSGTPSGTRHAPPSQLEAMPEEKGTTTTQSDGTHQRFVLTDMVAFRYLEGDPSTTVLERQTTLQGYVCYIVEQWTTSRTHPTFVITTYTGDPSNMVIVGVLSVPTDEAHWSPRLRVYFKALNQYHAKRRETPLGILMVTNLSGFPSSLTVIPVPDGDLRKHRFDFFVNENLKRLGCSGRVGLTLQPPTSATIAKFHQLYRTSDKNEVYQSVIELVKLCQSALMLFDKLEIDYADGLLCDVTERAITDWWVEIGSEQFNLEPHDGILGPTTVAGLLGLLMGARNRLHAVGAPVAKDPFDVEAMKRGISYFQKQQRMTRTRRLDRRTLDRLHKATQKAAEHERWMVPKVLKNTAAELSGKGGEMLVDSVGRRDRAGIAEIETCDFEHFIELIYGERAKWLWRGKPLKKHRQQEQHRDRAQSTVGLSKNLVFTHDDQGGFTWTARKSTGQALPIDQQGQPEEVGTPGDTDEEEERPGGLLKRATGLKNEAKSGLGKFRGAVGLKGHTQKVSADLDFPTTPVDDGGAAKRRPLFRRAHSSSLSSPTSPRSPRSPTVDNRLETLNERSRVATDPEHSQQTKDVPEYNAPLPRGSSDPSRESLAAPSYAGEHRNSSDTARTERTISDTQSATVTAEPSIAGSIYNGIDMDSILPTGPEIEKGISHLLRRTLSMSRFTSLQLEQRSDDAYPRHLSFSIAEESVLTWPSVTSEEDTEAHYNDAKAQLAEQDLLATEARTLRLALSTLDTETAPWTSTQLSILHTLLEDAERDTLTLTEIHEPQIEHVNKMQVHGEGVLRAERERLEEGSKEVEQLAAKLEYEINGLRGRIEDVEAGVLDFGRGVGRVEERVGELEADGERGRGWFGSCVAS